MAITTLFLDLNSYFASVEQQLRPELRGLPIAVGPEHETGHLIAASYEAKACGVKTAMRVGEAKKLCPDLIMVGGRHDIYVRIHHEVIAAVESVLPVQSVHSIDEMACRLRGPDAVPETALELAKQIKATIARDVGECMTSSIGIAPNRFLAKVCTELEKPDGLVLIDTHDLPHRLHELGLRDLPGIGPRMHERLIRRGITTVEALCALDEDEMVRVWKSVVGRQWHRWLRGCDDPGDSHTHRRSISHQHVLAPKRRTRETARAIVVRLLQKAAARARHLHYWPRRMTVDIKYMRGGSWSKRITLDGQPDTLTLVGQLGRAWEEAWEKNPDAVPLRVGVALHDLIPEASATGPLFPAEAKRLAVSGMIDDINRRYGRNTIYVGAMHETKDSAKDRIAFQSIPDEDVPA